MTEVAQFYLTEHKWCGMSERRLLEFAREGVIPARKIGGVWYFSPQKLAAFFDVSL